MSVQKEAHSPLLPRIQFFRRQRLKEFGTDVYLSLQSARLPIALGALDCNQANYGFRPTRNDDLLTAASLLNQL